MPAAKRTASRQDSSKSSKKKTDSKQQPSPEQLNYVKTLQTVLCRQYFKQLQLDFTVTLTAANNKFVQNVDVMEIDPRMQKDAMALKKEGRLDIFLHLINKFTSSNRFVGLFIQSLLEMQLTVNSKSYETSETTSHLIRSASHSFENIVDNFPPSWLPCLNVYKALFFNPLDIEVDFKSIHANSSDGLFQIILALIEDVLKDHGDNESSSQTFDSFANFQQFERNESQKSCYLKLSRDEKIERLFVVLNLMVKLMEIDLTVWINRYPFQTRTVMSNPNTVPLIAHLLWNGRECGQINQIIRNILKIFTTCIWIDFPDDKVDVLARLVNLVATAVNLSEHHQQENLITYPNIKSLNETFALEVTKSIETFPYTIDFYLNVIKKLRSPIIRMITTNRILSKFSKDFQTITLRKIVENLSDRVWMEYKENNGNSLKREQLSNEFTNYPIYNLSALKRSKKHLEIYLDEYVDLLFYEFESYVEVYRIHEILEMLISTSNQSDRCGKQREEEYNQLNKKATYEKSHQHDYTKLLEDWKALDTTSRKLAATDHTYIPESKKCENLYVDASLCTRCQEDLEYIIQLKDIIDRNFVEFGKTFEKWHSAIGRYLSFMK